MHSNFTVIFDACVLYPAPLRDLLMQLALTDLFRAKWTNQIHDEWIRNVLANRQDIPAEKLNRTRDLMNANVRDCLIENYEFLVESIKLPDPDDRHLVAAAIKSNASYIITYNLKDFPNDALEQYEIYAQHPDEFIYNQIELNVAKVCSAVAAQRASLKNPKMTQDELLDVFLKAGLSTTVACLKDWKHAF
jgi:predicted nucleic acid-binding protein